MARRVKARWWTEKREIRIRWRAKWGAIWWKIRFMQWIIWEG